MFRSYRTAPRAKHSVLPLVLSPILLVQEHISADFPDYPVSGHAPDTAKPWLLALAGHERIKVAVTHNKAFPFALTKIKAGKGALREFIFNAGAADYGTVRKARLS